MFKHKFTLFFFLIVSNGILAQQRPQYSQYMVNQFALNPAVAGQEEFTDIKAGYRNQWLGGFKGDGPVSYYLTAHTALGRPMTTAYGNHRHMAKGWHGLGVNIYNDITGPTRRTGAYLAYSYCLPVTPKYRLSIGAFLGAQQFSVNGNQFVLVDETDQVLNGVHSTIVPDLILGTWFYSKRLYVGIAAHQITQRGLDFKDAVVDNPDPSKLNAHYFLTAGYNIPISHFSIVPSIMVKYVTPAPVSIDLSAKIVYKEGLFWWGASYRNLDSFTLIVGTTILDGRMPISYSYDLSVSKLIKYNTGSHEIVVGYKIPLPHRTICASNFW
jgi:type IX secretion system PorP/SprF family membrane protein